MVMDENDAVELIGFLVKSKAIWKNPELLTLVESAPSPTKTHTMVLNHTSSRRKALAARWYACAIRDYGKDSLSALVAVLQSPQGVEKLEKLLTSNHTLENRVDEGGMK